jgi:hypothetical protein
MWYSQLAVTGIDLLSPHDKAGQVVIESPLLTERLTTQTVDYLEALRVRGMRPNLYSSTQPVRLGTCVIGVLMVVISVIVLVAEAVGAF